MTRTLGKPRNPGYKSGSHWANCWSCGFTFRQEQLKQTWDNRWVCDADFEHRHEQDFLRAKEEKISVGQPILHDPDNNVRTSAQTIGAVTTTAATFGNTDAVVGYAEAGRAIVGTDDAIPDGTFNRNTL